MWTEYHPIREMTMGSPDPSCFKMDANHAVQNVLSGGTMSPVAGAGAVAAGASSGGSGIAGGRSGGGSSGGDDDETNLDFSGNVIGATKNAGDEAINAEKAGLESEMDDLKSTEGERVKTETGVDPDKPADLERWRREQKELADRHGDAIDGERAAEGDQRAATDAENRAAAEAEAANRAAAEADARRKAFDERARDLDDRLKNTTDPAEKARLQSELDQARRNASAGERARAEADAARTRAEADLDAARNRSRLSEKDLENARNRRSELDTDMKNARARDKALSDYNARKNDLQDRFADADVRSRRLGNLSDGANILLDWKNLMQKDGMSFVEAGVTSIAGNLGANAATAKIGLADFAAGIFFPQSMQGYVPGNVVKDSVKTGVNALKAASQALGGDSEALDRYGDSAMSGNEGKIAEGYANIADALGSLFGDPSATLKDLGQGMKDIWNAGPLELINDAAGRFAADALSGKEGPMAQTIAELAQGTGRLSTDPVGVAGELKDDLGTIIEHGNPSDLIFGEEGSNRATQILGPIGEGYKEAAGLAGEIYENPTGFASDVKDTTIYVAKETAGAIKDTTVSAWRGLKGFFGY
jgi:hypothetical protein